MLMNRETKRTVIGLILFTAVIVLAVIHFKSILALGCYALSVVAPFAIGAAIAFVINIPMLAIEKKLFGKARKKTAKKLARPCSILITFFLCVLILILIAFLVIPQVTDAIKELPNRISTFMAILLTDITAWMSRYPILQEEIEKLQEIKIDWSEVINKIVEFLGNGVGTTALVNTMSIAGNIIGGVTKAFIALIFSFYVLSSKEKLQSQANRLVQAFFNDKWEQKVKKLAVLLYNCFRNYISGQFVEALILGSLFLIILSIGGFPYALLISVLIAITSLIPIVGAFIGCIVGAFLIVMDDPLKALWFIIVFLILQQIEGNLIYPKVVGETVGLPAMWVLMAVTIGGSLFGVMGMLVFIPLTSAAYTLTREATQARLAEKRAESKADKIPENNTAEKEMKAVKSKPANRKKISK